MFENPRRGRQARNFTKNVPKILDLKSSSEQIFSENWRWVPLNCAWNLAFPVFISPIVWNMCENISKSYTTSKNAIDRQYTERGQL